MQGCVAVVTDSLVICYTYNVCLQAVYRLEDIQKKAAEVGYFLNSTSISCDMMVKDLNDLVSLSCGVV